MNYTPHPPAGDPKALMEYVYRELQAVAKQLKDDAPRVAYASLAVDAGTLSAGVSANWKIPAGNIVRLSLSATLTLTGIADKTPNRIRVLRNVGTAALVLVSGSANSSASYRFNFALDYNISQNHAITLWYDPKIARHVALSRT